MAIKIDEVVEVLRSNQVPSNTVNAVIEELKQVEAEKKNANTAPKSKKQYVIISNPQSSEAGYVVQIEEDQDAGTTVDKVRLAGRAYNASRKGTKTPARSLTEVLSLPRKFLVDAGIWVKTKEPTRTISLGNNTL